MNHRAAVLLTGLSLLLIPGCYADVESFVVASAKHTCKRIKKCHRSAFVNNHNDNMGECRSDQEDDLFDLVDILEDGGWEYDQDAGQRCVAVVRDLRGDCSEEADREISEECEDVFFDGF